MVCGIGEFLVNPRHEDTTFSFGIDRKIHIRELWSIIVSDGGGTVEVNERRTLDSNLAIIERKP